MSLGQFMPLFHGSQSTIADPNAAYVIMSLKMENNGDGFTLVDDSINTNVFTRAGNAQLSGVNPKFGKTSATFDGTGDYYHSNAKALYNQPGDFTVELWLRFSQTRTSGNSYFISHATDWEYSEPALFINNSTRKICYYSGNTNRIVGTTTINDGRWYHISYGRAGNNTYLYVDGVLQGTWAHTSSVSTWSCSLGTHGAARNTSATDHFSGFIDEVRWWKGISVRNGVNGFTPPKASWAPLPSSIFRPITITPVLRATGDRGYTRGSLGSLSAEPFAGYTVATISQTVSSVVFYTVVITMSGTMTEAQFLTFKARIPALKLTRSSDFLLDDPVRSSTGVVTITGKATGIIPFTEGTTAQLVAQ